MWGCRVHSRPPAYAGELVGSARGLAVNAQMPSDDPAFPAAQQYDGHALQPRVIRRLAGDFGSVIRRYSEWT